MSNVYDKDTYKQYYAEFDKSCKRVEVYKTQNRELTKNQDKI